MTVNFKDVAKVYIRSLFDHFGHFSHFNQSQHVYKGRHPNHLSRCFLCQLPLPAHQSSLKEPICTPCLADLPWLRPAALCHCGLPRQQHQPCICAQLPTQVDGIYPLFSYHYPVDRLINLYKHQHDLNIERALLQCWQRRPLPPAIGQADALIPVPLHGLRLRQRGFNQAARLAHQISRITGTPVCDALKRHSYHQRQQGLSRAKRQANAQHVFLCQKPIKGEKLVLIDDVVTTGATALACANTLLKAGATQVSISCLARTIVIKNVNNNATSSANTNE